MEGQSTTLVLKRQGSTRVVDYSCDLQHFVLQKMETGLSWASCDHLRNLMSKIFTTAVARSGRVAQGRPGTVGPHETFYHARNLHRTNSRASAGGGRKLGAFGDQSC